MLDIKEGEIPRAQKVVIYGPEGIGKTTLASQFPYPLFIDTESGTSHMNVRRIEKPKTWDSLLNIVNEIANNHNVCKTLVIDTADWAEQLTITKVCTKYQKESIEEFGYSKGYTYLSEEFTKLLKALDKVIAAGIHVVVTAHAKMRKFEQPDELGAYDRWEMKLSKQVAPLLKEWCDLLLFCNYKTYVIQSNNAMEKSKVQGGQRVMYTTHHPCWDAKNRHSLPDELPLSYDRIAQIFSDEPEHEIRPIDTLYEMMERDGVTEDQVRKVTSDKGKQPPDLEISQYDDKFINGWLITYWDKILEIIKNEKENNNG